MRYLSVCSGIEAASVAWHGLGWEPAAFSEIDPFASAVLAARFPSVPNLGDMERFNEWPELEIDLLVGGTPCQAFSVAGLRRGLADPRGNLALVYLSVVDRYRPRYVVWENVPGVLSSSGGRDFGAFLGGLAELGYGWSYRVLDAQYVRVESHPRAVPQRRRRVFVVGCSGGDWKRAASILLEPEGVRGDSAPSREAREEAPRGARAGAAAGGVAGAVAFQWPVDVADPITANEGGTYTHEGSRNFRLHNVVPSAPLPFDTTQVTSVLNRSAPQHGDPCHPLTRGGHPPAVAFAENPRRLTPRECERLQGFPDDWTAIQYRNKPAADSPRYKALGNSMAVNVMRWIGERIATVKTCSTCSAAFHVEYYQSPTRADECTACYFRRTGHRPAGPHAPEESRMMKKVEVLDSKQVEEETRAEAVAARGILDELRALHVESAEEIAVAGELLRDVKGEYKRLDERLKTVTRPLNDALKAARDLFRPALVALEEAEVLLKGKIGQAQLALSESNRRAQEATQAALAAGDVRAAAVASSAISTTEAPQGLSYRDAWTYQIVDESKLPREFLCPDARKIAAHVKVHGDKSPIPGVQIARDVQVIARAK